MSSTFQGQPPLEAIAADAVHELPEVSMLSNIARTAKRLYHDRRRRDQLFGQELFGEPAWDILLDLRIQRAEGRSPSVSSACIGAAAPPTTALRYMLALEKRGLIVRYLDPHDARRKFAALSAEGLALMDAYLAEVAGNAPIPSG